MAANEELEYLLNLILEGRLQFVRQLSQLKILFEKVFYTYR